MSKKEEQNMVPVKDLVKESKEKSDPAEEAAILCPPKRCMTISYREFNLRKLNLRDFQILAREVTEVFGTFFASTEGDKVPPPDYLALMMPSVVAVMARTLNTETEWLQENAGPEHLLEWFAKFLNLHTDKELESIRENFIAVKVRARLLAKLWKNSRPSTDGQKMESST